jgi:hypothetical protein
MLIDWFLSLGAHLFEWVLSKMVGFDASWLDGVYSVGHDITTFLGLPGAGVLFGIIQPGRMVYLLGSYFAFFGIALTVRLVIYVEGFFWMNGAKS